jgi:hypothetical protein
MKALAEGLVAFEGINEKCERNTPITNSIKTSFDDWRSRSHGWRSESHMEEAMDPFPVKLVRTITDYSATFLTVPGHSR